VTIFKAYDIRGIYPDQLNERIAYAIGFHFATWLGRGPIVIGRDIRDSSVPLSASLAQGIQDAGFCVCDLGRATTPMVYFATGTLGAAGGVQVTASHNPPEYNGLKLCREEAIPVGSASGLADVQARVEADPAPEAVSTPGTCAAHDILPAFRAFLAEHAQGIPALKVCIDTGNGVVGPFVEPLLGGTPLEIRPLFFEPDGRFPNHEANPLKLENLRDVQRVVVEEGCDLGIAFDGDGDRAAFVDEQGQPVPGDIVTALIARDILARQPGPVLYDLRSSRAVPEEIEKAGGTPIETRVGHAFIKATMREHGAVFAGEVSGHYYFREAFCAESAFLAVLSVLRLIGQAQKPLSELVAPLDRYPRTGEVNFRVADKGEALRRIEARFADAEAIEHLDGVTVRYADWWANVRASNTEPLLRLNLEAQDAETLARVRPWVVEAIGAEPAL